ncbi:MAG: heterodisulfide reductase-related iron-sulfur binding cluster [Actinomycetes bacterium]
MSDLPLLPAIPDDLAAAALHGSWCPKLCNHACPVLAATGRDDAVPWSLHRTVSDLATGRLEPDDRAAARLTACSGCLGCQEPCTFDQDVPAQVRAGRAATAGAGAPVPGHDAAVAAVSAGTSPHGVPRADGVAPGATAGATAVLVGCRDTPDVVAALLALLRAAGEDAVAVAPAGCCGATLRDLGAVPAADAARDATAGALTGAARVVLLDPHCAPEAAAAVADDVEVVHAVEAVWRHLEAGAITLRADLGPATYHDPCLLARDARLVEEPRTLLRTAGAELVEPEHHGPDVACAGGGLALPLVDPGAAEATADRRRGHLAATGAPLVVTACAGARERLAADGSAVADLFTVLAERLVSEA